MFAGGTAVQVVIPWQLVIPLLLVWTLAVFGVRLFILCLALREPLTGRVAMGGRKARRYRRLRTHLVSLLSTLLGVVVLFAGVELIRHASWLDYWPPSLLTRSVCFAIIAFHIGQKQHPA